MNEDRLYGLIVGDIKAKSAEINSEVFSWSLKNELIHEMHYRTARNRCLNNNRLYLTAKQKIRIEVKNAFIATSEL